MPSITPETVLLEVTGGVDTHQDTHTAAVIDQVGRVLGTRQFPATPAGYTALLTWMRGHGPLARAGVEGTGSYGAGLTRLLQAHGVTVIEIDRPNRRTRRQQGKSDPIDAVAAAKTALAAERTGLPKQRDGRVEAIRNLRLARSSAVEQRADVQRRIRSQIVTAPDQLRTRLHGLTATKLINTCAQLQPDPAAAATPATATEISLRSMARRHQYLTAEITDLDEQLKPLVTAVNPALVSVQGIGIDAAGQLLTTAGENHDRLTSEAAFAMLCGVAPLPASSGRTNRHRLNRGGDRQANATIYRIVLNRLRWDPRTRAYTERRTKEGLSKKEIIRCLKRYVAREIYQIITTSHPQLTT